MNSQTWWDGNTNNMSNPMHQNPYQITKVLYPEEPSRSPVTTILPILLKLCNKLIDLNKMFH